MPTMRRGVLRLIEGGTRRPAVRLALVLVAVPFPRASADALLLLDGSSVEGDLKESSTEFEVVTDHGSLWVDKVNVKKRYPPIDAILASVQQSREQARTLFEQAKQIDEKTLHNTKLREAVKLLEAARDTLAEAQEVYTAMGSYLRLSQPFKSIIQELRLYRDQFQVGGTSGGNAAAAVPAAKPAVEGRAAPVSAPAGTAPDAAATGAAGASASGMNGASAAGLPAAPPEAAAMALAAEIRRLASQGAVDDAYAGYQRYLKEGGEDAGVRADVARAFFDRGMRQTPPVLADLRRAFDLDPNALTYYESYMQASYDKGLDSAKRKQWNDATKEFTQAIRAASELLAKSEKAKYHNVRGMAYHWRGISEVQKFRGKGGHLQIRSDYRQAQADYEAVIRLEPGGPYAAEARDNLQNVKNTLKLLR